MVALSGDYDFQFMIEELAVGAQFKLPYIHVLVNNAYLGLIRRAQRGFDMDYCVQLSFENINNAEIGEYGVDHVKVAEGLGCKALRVFKPEEIAPAFRQAQELMQQHRVPVVVEIIPSASPIFPWAPSWITSTSSNRWRQRRKTRRPRSTSLITVEGLTMPKFSANLSMLFTEVDFMQRFRRAKEQGFSAVEYMFPYDYPIAALRSELEAHRLSRCCSTCRPATGRRANGASPACRGAKRSSATASGARSSMRKRWAAIASTA